MIESSLVIYQSTIIDINRGTPTSVEFNFERVWDFCKTKKNFDPLELDFYHVHPTSFRTYSELDLNCMIGYKMAFGKPIYFNIIIFDDTSLHNLLHEQKCFILNEDNTVKEIRPPYEPIIPLSEHALSILKLISYGDIK